MAVIAKPTVLKVTSSVFESGRAIPKKYACEGKNINPPLSIYDIPEKTKSMALIIEDLDVPQFDHWLVWNIAPLKEIRENSVPGIQGKNGSGEDNYTGPCPPSGTHRYAFKVFALDVELTLEKGANKKALEKAMKKHILAQGELIGLYPFEKEDNVEDTNGN